MSTILITPLGLAPGLLFSAVRLVAPDAVVIITSGQGAALVPEALARAGFAGQWHAVELADPHTGFAETPRVQAKVLDLLRGAGPDTGIVVNYTGGTTAIQYVVTRLDEELRAAGWTVRRVALVDRRLPEEQRREPYRVGELVDLP